MRSEDVTNDINQLGHNVLEFQRNETPEILGNPMAGPAQADIEQKPAVPELDTAQVIAPVVQIGFGIIASRRGAHWNLSKEETQALSGALADVLNKYMPSTSLGCEVTLLMTAGMIALPRLEADKRIGTQVSNGSDEAKTAKEKKPRATTKKK